MGLTRTLRRLLGRSSRGPIPVPLQEQLASGRAAAMRHPLREALAHEAPPWVGTLAYQARAAGWTEIEVDKLQAYLEFFSGDSARAYDRVVRGRLAEADADLLLTACEYCYRHDRFAEGYGLVRQFRAESADSSQAAGYLAVAGYLALAAGADISEAVSYFDRALDGGQVGPMLAVNAYPIYFEAGRHDRVAQLRRLIHERYALDPDARFALASVELCRGYYAEGFRLAEARYDMPESARAINATLPNERLWRGESLAGKRLLVHGEQGFGDTIMMARYLPELQRQAASVIVDARDAAVPLLAENFPGCQIVPGGFQQELDVDFDFWVGIMSLPHRLGTVRETVPLRQSYLRAPAEQAAYWRRRIGDRGTGGCRIGVAWSGNPSHRADRRRSLPFASLIPHLSAHSNLRFFALQTQVPSNLPANLIDLSDEMTTLADTAALIDLMDLVITVDTSVVHLAGALGRPTWLLLPPRYEWRWGLEGESNAWYDSVRVLRQKAGQGWSALLSDVFQEQLPAWLATSGV